MDAIYRIDMFTFVCSDCGHAKGAQETLEGSHLLEKLDEGGLRAVLHRLICSQCHGRNIALVDRDIGVARANTEMNSDDLSGSENREMLDTDRAPSEKLCVTCGEPISEGRVRALPDTTVCVDCASLHPKTKRIAYEPMGSREDYKKDSGRNFGGSGNNRVF
ncbi:TraR/DksA C4-type zinc finger protein [Altererythrobacter sp. GH1-8]|uniref:TraR/DksA C4-type zinc finger protein n=1 Tax=Altererythrobacter sp. GH1-8 TaxID=3349333 RepID=UPI00374D2F53